MKADYNIDQNRLQRLPQLDALRGIAVLWVILFHWTDRYSQLYSVDQRSWLNIPDGRYGVHLFFMISGFVILLTIDKTRSIKDFAFFRWARLYPTLWICGLITFATVTLFGLPGREVPLKDALINITMLPYFFGFEFIDSAYWSLEIEFFFYVLMGSIVGCGLRRYLVPILLTLVAANLLLLSFLDPVNDLSKIVKGLRFVLCLRYLHLFLFGIICYESTQRKQFWQVPLLIFCLFAILFAQDKENPLLGIALAGIFWLASQKQVAILHFRWLIFLGFISYPLYLIHQNLGFVILRALDPLGLPYLVSLSITALLVFLLASLLSYKVEHPLNKWLRNWYRLRVTKD